MRKGRDGIGGFGKRVGCGGVLCFALLRPCVVDAFCFGEECPDRMPASIVSLPDSFCPFLLQSRRRRRARIFLGRSGVQLQYQLSGIVGIGESVVLVSFSEEGGPIEMEACETKKQ